ncbi:hypothetical protein A6E05_08505 [Aliivibrio sp. 1S165]|uniref:hypothetical protein n=1 Tax=unclassified Aliivibrio TaxID=2645654 RepID=UPI00080EC6DC|nr:MULTISPECIES: hypothetical protein [unclassified Aliivibrio]OCH13162.1 hypothetical protein A6E05_08505 [Aliivibrio sp. 1S165]OCH28148.1 hypothetical protein A6E06_06930 [Aliivibrio sp. 1S175]
MACIKSLLASSIAIILVGCGGSDSNNDNTGGNNPVSGKVIDGYVVGANVFLDLNNNGLHDRGEPFNKSDENGDYKMSLSNADYECLQWVPTIVQVPVGAMDLDLGVVTEAYEMIIPPTYDPLANSSSRHATPLTTMLWNSVSANKTSADSAVGMTCAEIKTNVNAQNIARIALHDSISFVEIQYGVTEEDIYSDFVARGDVETHEKAMKIVKGLKKSYPESIEIRHQYPEAWHASVNYYFTNDNTRNLDKWYRNIQVVGNIDMIATTYRMEDDLSTEMYLVYESFQEANEKFTYNPTGYKHELISFNSTAALSTDGNGDYIVGEYDCVQSESIGVTNQQGENIGDIKSITNSYTLHNVTDPKTECSSFDSNLIDDQSVSQNEYNRNSLNQLAKSNSYVFNASNPAPHGWVDFKNTFVDVNEVVEFVDSYSNDFDTNDTEGASNTARYINYMDNNNEVYINKSIIDNDGVIGLSCNRTTRFADGSELLFETSTDCVNWTVQEF